MFRRKRSTSRWVANCVMRVGLLARAISTATNWRAREAAPSGDYAPSASANCSRFSRCMIGPGRQELFIHSTGGSRSHLSDVLRSIRLLRRLQHLEALARLVRSTRLR